MTTWHASDDVLARFARQPEVLDHPTASSVELHLIGCERCRAQVAALVDDAALEASWHSVADRIDASRASLSERVLRRVGLGDGAARIVAATPALRLSWLASLALLVGSVAGLAHRLHDPGPFLVVAPLIPLGAVALAFWPSGDPAGEAGRAAPLAGLALALRRAAAVLVPAVAAVVIGSIATPVLAPLDAAWLLPALALSAGTVALATWVRVDTAAAVLAGAWLAVVTALHVRQAVPLRDITLFASRAHLAWLGLALASAGVAYARRHAFAYSRRSL
jgi:hypothetical protein